jgi:arsenate reductase
MSEGEERKYNILFLCTANSARSVIAEAVMRRDGARHFNSYSAGSRPAGAVNPQALHVVEGLGFSPAEFRSKSWEEFAGPGVPKMDFVITVCDNAAGEPCPVWPGQPITAHWGIPDPAAAQGTPAEVSLAFADACRMLTNRIRLFLSLPIASLDKMSLQRRMREIGHIDSKDVAHDA